MSKKSDEIVEEVVDQVGEVPLVEDEAEPESTDSAKPKSTAKPKKSKFPKNTAVFAIVQETNHVYNVKATLTRGRIIHGVNSVILLPNTRVLFRTNIEEEVEIAPDMENVYLKKGFDCRFFYSKEEKCMMVVVTNLNPKRFEFNGAFEIGKVK